jgi:hypothetical protein
MFYRVIDANVAWRVVDEEAVLLHADSSAYFGLNQTGTLLWAKLAQQPMTLDQLDSWARKKFSGAPADVRGEVSAFIDELVELELVESTDSVVPGTSAEATNGTTAPVWERPAVERFGELEKLILSGE